VAEMFGGVKRSSLFHKGLNYRNRYFYCKCLTRTNFITSACAFKTILNPGVINQCVCHCRTLPTKFKLCLGLGPFKAVPEICGSGKRPSLFYYCCTNMSEIGFFASYHPVPLNGMGISFLSVKKIPFM